MCTVRCKQNTTCVRPIMYTDVIACIHLKKIFCSLVKKGGAMQYSSSDRSMERWHN